MDSDSLPSSATNVESPSSPPVPGAQALAEQTRLSILAALLILAAAAVYFNSLACPFIFDDVQGIANNEYIRTLWPPWRPLQAPYRSTLSGRPILSLSFAINYAIGGSTVRGYHLTNVAIHAVAALLLFGVVRRTLRCGRLATRFGAASAPIAFAAALIWVVHPLQTQSVTYIIQRAESLMGMLYLATLYAFIRSLQSPRAGAWRAVSVACCFLGMGVKEVMVTAPLLVLFYDAVFAAGSFAAALRRNRPYYALLFASWIFLGALNASWPRGSTAGLSVRGIGVLSYALTQPGVLLHYVSLSLWPAGLCVDYGWKTVESLRDAIGPLVVIVVALGITLWACIRRPALGFVLASFFLILAPTSSVIPLQNPAFDYRMYLPLAALTVCFVVIAASLTGIGRSRGDGAQRPWSAAPLLIVAFAAAAALGWRTIVRNRDYASALSIWTDVLHKRPSNHRGYVGVGMHCAEQGDLDAALQHFARALELYPDSRHAHYFTALVLTRLNRVDEALPHVQKAIELEPDLYEDRNLCGVLLHAKGRHEDAAGQFAEALRLKPDSGAAHLGLARSQVRLRKFDDAATHYQRAIELGFQADVARVELGDLLIQLRLYENAARIYQESLRLNPDQPMVLNRLGFALLKMNRAEEAAEALKAALAADPKIAPAHFNYADALVALQRYDEALREYEEARRLKADLPRLAERIADVRRKLAGDPQTASAPAGQAGDRP